MNKKDTHKKLVGLSTGLNTQRLNDFIDFYIEERNESDKIKDIFDTLCNNHFPEIAELNIADQEDVLQILETYYKYKGKREEKKEEEIDVKALRMSVIDFLMERYTFKTLDDTDEVLIYDPDEGIYTSKAKTLIISETKRLMGDEYSKYQSNEVIANIQALTYTDRKEFDKEEGGWIVVQNGLLNIFSEEFKDFTPDFLATVKIPTKYDKEAKCLAIEKFLSEVVSGKDRLAIEEMGGYTLYPGIGFEVWFLLVGDGANGKSTYLALLVTFLGDENVSSVTLQGLNARFALAGLIGKLANIVDDLSSSELKQTGVLKRVTDKKGYLEAEKKGIQDRFGFFNRAKLIFSCNQVPLTEDKSRAFFRRYIPIYFSNHFIVKKNADKKLLEKLTTEEELSGFLNLSLKALRGLLDNDEFSNDLTAEEKEDLYERASNPVYSFFHDRCEIEYEGYTVKTELYDAFCSYCKEIKAVAFSEKKFIQQLRLLTNLEGMYKVIGEKGVRKSVWLGIVLKICEPCEPCEPLNPYLGIQFTIYNNYSTKISNIGNISKGKKGSHPSHPSHSLSNPSNYRTNILEALKTDIFLKNLQIIEKNNLSKESLHNHSENLNDGACENCGEYTFLIYNAKTGRGLCRECQGINV